MAAEAEERKGGAEAAGAAEVELAEAEGVGLRAAAA